MSVNRESIQLSSRSSVLSCWFDNNLNIWIFSLLFFIQYFLCVEFTPLCIYLAMLFKVGCLNFFSHFFTSLVGPSEKLHTRKNFVFFFQKMFWLFICARIIIFTCWKLNHVAREFFLNFILFILFYEYPARLYDASLKLWMNEINLIKFRSFNIIFSSPHRRSDWVSPSTLFFFSSSNETESSKQTAEYASQARSTLLHSLYIFSHTASRVKLWARKSHPATATLVGFHSFSCCCRCFTLLARATRAHFSGQSLTYGALRLCL